MRRASVEEAFPLFHTCFPEVNKRSLAVCQSWMIYYIYEDKAFCCVYPHTSGLIIQYMGVLPEYRGEGLCRRMLERLKFLYPELDFYGECVPGGHMYGFLLRGGWSRIPIRYVCPAWGEEPEDRGLDLLVLPCGKQPKNVLGFLTDFYRSGFQTPCDDLLDSYRRELEQGPYRAKFTEICENSKLQLNELLLDCAEKLILNLPFFQMCKKFGAHLAGNDEGDKFYRDPFEKSLYQTYNELQYTKPSADVWPEWGNAAGKYPFY